MGDAITFTAEEQKALAAEQTEELRKEAVSTGEMFKLNPEKLPDEQRRMQFDGYLSQLKHWK